jgi:hypothetical protein
MRTVKKHTQEHRDYSRRTQDQPLQIGKLRFSHAELFQATESIFGRLCCIATGMQFDQIFHGFSGGLQVLELDQTIRNGQHGIWGTRVEWRNAQELSKIEHRLFVVFGGVLCIA